MAYACHLLIRWTKIKSNWIVKYKAVNCILEDGKYYIYIGADAPCSVSLNIGGKIFRAHHDEIQKGCIVGANVSLKDIKVDIKSSEAFTRSITKTMGK
jgi:hypothetical protein